MPVTPPIVLADGLKPSWPEQSATEHGWPGWAMAGAMALFLAGLAAAGTVPPRPAPAPPATKNATTGGASLVVHSVEPDELVALLAPPNHGFCGTVELRLDGVPVRPGLVVEIPGGVIVTLSGATSGTHVLELIAGIPAPKANGQCRDGAHHRRVIASGTVGV